jgi:hypothetical protein
VTQPIPEQVIPPLVDPGNPFIGQYPAQLQLGIGQGPQGPAMIMSIRCGPASLAVLLTREQAKQWGREIVDNADKVSPLMIPGNGVPPFPTPHPGKQP